MFQGRPKTQGDVSGAPDAIEWWERSIGRDDLVEQCARLTQQLRSALALANRSEKPIFLRVLGQDLDTELEKLAARVAFPVDESSSELGQRRELLEDLIDYYCDAVMPWTQAPRPVELSDCAREAVAALSADMVLLLRVGGEPVVNAGRRRLIALFELAIRAATADAEDEVEVVLPPCSAEHAELRVQWTRAAMSPRDSHDKGRFLALAVAYVIKLGGTLQRTTGSHEALVLRIPLSQRAEDGLSLPPILDFDVVAQATAFCLEG